MSKFIFFLLLISCFSKKQEKKIAKIDIHNLAQKSWPKKIAKSDIKYVFNKKLVAYLREILIKSKSDQVAVSVIENETGNVLALVGRNNKKKIDNDNLALRPFSPAASLIKVVTSADLIENHEVKQETGEFFKGKKATLYKYQLKNDQKGKKVSLHQAFSTSNNVVFAKLAAKFSSPISLFETAQKFYFNEKLPILNLDIEESYFPIPESKYMFAEVASGLNKKTLLSPLHAAYIISGIANNGIMTPLKIIKRKAMGAIERLKEKRILSRGTTDLLMKMMESVVSYGTARSLTSKASRKIKRDLKFGGKTGRMTGGVPYGTRDWLAFYIKPRNIEDKGWSVAVMINNEEQWTVRPTFIAKKVLEYYHSNVLRN